MIICTAPCDETSCRRNLKILQTMTADEIEGGEVEFRDLSKDCEEFFPRDKGIDLEVENIRMSRLPMSRRIERISDLIRLRLKASDIDKAEKDIKSLFRLIGIDESDYVIDMADKLVTFRAIIDDKQRYWQVSSTGLTSGKKA